MSKTSKFILFLVFNIIFGILALSMIIIGTIALFKLHEFNMYVLIFVIFKLFVFVMCILGIISREMPNLLLFYIISSAIIFSIEIIFGVLILCIKELKQYLIDTVNELIKLSEDEKDEIPRFVILILGIDCFIGILSFVFCLVYYKSSDDEFGQSLISKYFKAKNSYTRSNESLSDSIKTN